MSGPFGDLKPFLDLSSGLPRPSWDSIAQNIADRALGDAVWAVWNDALQQWLSCLAAHFGKPFAVRESTTFLLMHDLTAADAEALSQDAECIWSDIRRILGPIAEDGWYAKRVILAFGKNAPFVDYIAPLLPEGESMCPGGLLISAGFLHVVLGPGWSGTRSIVLQHELTHLALVQLPAPLWLHEGLAVIVQKTLRGTDALPTVESLHECRAFWRDTELATFWRGASFADPGRSSEFSYVLAEILTRNLLDRHSQRFADFVRAAVWDDAGNAAAQEHLGMNLGDVAGEFLGAGQWGPDVTRINARSIDSEAGRE